MAVGESAGVLSERAVRLSSMDHTDTLRRQTYLSLTPAAIAIAAMLLIWIPLDVAASTRSAWSPWPTWSARALQAVGLSARDYEIDGHRLWPHDHRS